MSRPSLITAAVALLGASATAQNDISSRLMPVTVPFEHAGIYHVATGTWTRHGSLENLAGPDTIYNNSCAIGGGQYFAAMVSGEKWQHSSRVPTTALNGAPTIVSTFYPLRNDEAPGCQTSYVVNGFQIRYCTSRNSILGNFDQRFEFADMYNTGDCGGVDMIPNAGASFTVSLLPGTAAAGQVCRIVDIDLTGTPFTLQADQDGIYQGPSDMETFGYSQGPTTAGMTTQQLSGPIIAGNFTWTGGPMHPNSVPCSGTDGTIWDSPIDLTEGGTGMFSQDFFRMTGTTPAPSGPACYTFGAASSPQNIHSDFYLKLFADANCQPVSPMIGECFPGTGGVLNCPCPSQAPSNPAGGCANHGAGSTSGAVLSASGTASVTNDTVVLTTSNHRAPAGGVLNVFFSYKPGSATPTPGSVSGAGVRCIGTGGNLKRLYTEQVFGGTGSVPGMGDPSVTQVSASFPNNQHTISAGETRHYFNVYRDGQASLPANCNNPGTTTNLTNMGRILWGP
ncbi:MAG: hypothetical protein ACKVXR_17785 [Planctomycetota bacterium]